MRKPHPKNCQTCGKEITRTRPAKYCLKCAGERYKQQNRKASRKHYEKTKKAKHSNKTKNNVGYIKIKNTTLKPLIKAKLIFGHNFSLKFPLREDCQIPFNKNFFNYTKLPRGKNNVRYDFHHSQGFVRQTNKSLIIFPHLEKEAALPRNSYKLKARLSEKAFAIAKDLMDTNVSLHLSLPAKPSTEEYAIRDGYAHECDFTFENEFAKMDKSPHFEEGGYQGTGGEHRPRLGLCAYSTRRIGLPVM